MEKEVKHPKALFSNSPKDDCYGSAAKRGSFLGDVFRRFPRAKHEEFREKPSPSNESVSPEIDNSLFKGGTCFHHYWSLNPETRQPISAEDYANDSGIKRPILEQYTIYLFERILLCCKELNPNKKQKDKLKLDKKAPDKRATTNGGKPTKLQLKGRIFMTNVTDVISLVKPGTPTSSASRGSSSDARTGSYTVQIWWKGDPGVENFIIRFSNEEVMKKWSAGVDGQRKQWSSPAPNSQEAPPNFAWMAEQAGTLPNPYAEEDDDDDALPTPQDPNAQSGFSVSRAASSSSLRSRSTTGESTTGRQPPPRFPVGLLTQPPLSVQTHVPGQLSPNLRTSAGDSYFSPVVESPMPSARISNGGTTSTFPFPRQGTPQGSWDESNIQNRYDPNRNTAPAMARGMSRENVNNPYQSGRNTQRTSQGSPGREGQQRSRSYSTPDINNISGAPNRRQANQGPVPAVPGIPAHLHPAYDSALPRSNSNSPQNGLTANAALRTNTQSPGASQRLNQFPTQPVYQRSTPQLTNIPPPMSDPRAPTLSPPLNTAPLPSSGDVSLPTQLKVKVNCDGNYVTLVVPFNITYQSLIDRIDAKVGRFSDNAIGRGTMRLRYQDEDGDFVTIESDDDIQIAFQEWREMSKSQFSTGSLGEIELFCASVDHA